MKTQYNQAVTMAPVFFDAVGKKAHFEEKDGKKLIIYLEDPPAVMLKGGGMVTFRYEAPAAKTVEVGEMCIRDRLWYNWAMKLSSINLTEEDNASGKGFINVPVEDLKLFQVSDSYYGTGRVWGLGSKVDAETKERIMEFFDWMASPEGATYMLSLIPISG